MNFRSTIVTTLLSLWGISSIAQSEDITGKLIDKKWHVASYEMGGQKIPSTDAEETSYSIFYADKNFKTNDHGSIMFGKWKYEPATNSVILYSEESTQQNEMKIVSLTDNEYVFTTTTEEGMPLTIHMTNVTAKTDLK